MEKKKNILIVEDEIIIAKHIQSSLEKLGYEICGQASTGENAIELAKEHSPDLVLMDIELKGDMDGIAAAGEIQKRFYIPVIFLSSYSDEGVLNRAKDARPLSYLLKPFQERELLSNIEMAVYRHQLEMERDRLLAELQEAMKEIKLLSGMIPICSQCKNIRSDEGYWKKIEDYIESHTDAIFTHSLCPHCSEKLYGSEGWYGKVKNKPKKEK